LRTVTRRCSSPRRAATLMATGSRLGSTPCLNAFSSRGCRGLAAGLGEEPANVALAWLLHNPVVRAPIIGPRTGEQLEQTLRCTELKLEQSVLDRLDAIFPGAGGEAPKAYAW
jgi:aryl-alcohol dehydrogenase-like predicted oxidoreductase